MKHLVVVIILLFLAACGENKAASPAETTSSTPAMTPSLDPFADVSGTPTIFGTATSIYIAISETPGPPTETPRPSSTPRLNGTLKPGRGILLLSMQMLDSQTGWGIDTGYHLLRTTNGGQTWQDVSPEIGYYNPAGFFALDPDTAWATFTKELFLSPQTANVWHTKDGGESWTRSQELRLDLDQYGNPYSYAFYLPQGMQFIDRKTGWLLAAVDYGMQSARPLFFQTTDGGDTWKTINSRDGFPDSCVAVGFVFIDPQTGWAGGNCFAQGVLAMRMQSLFADSGWSVGKTLDGGTTYEGRTMMPVPAEMQVPGVLAAEGGCGEIRLLHIKADAVGIEWGCSLFTSLKPDYRFFALSPDGGRTWTSWKSAGNESFLDAQHGWRLLSPGELQQTTDGGVNWVTIKKVTWEDAEFDFVSEQEGWAIASIGQGQALLHTVNGGQMWTDLHPLVGP